MPPTIKARRRALREALALTIPVYIGVLALVAFTIDRDAKGLRQTDGRPAAAMPLRP